MCVFISYRFFLLAQRYGRGMASDDDLASRMVQFAYLQVKPGLCEPLPVGKISQEQRKDPKLPSSRRHRRRRRQGGNANLLPISS